MRVVVFGAGAVGSLLGARLAASGTHVELVGRPDHVRAIRENGLLVDEVPPLVLRIPAAESPTPGPSPDAVLLTVKSFDLEDAGAGIARAFPREVPVFALQNGLGIERRLGDGLRGGGWSVPEPWIVRAVNSVPATWVGPGRVRPGGDSEVVLAGVAGRAIPAIAEELHRSLTAARIPVRLVEDLGREVWRKALLNAAINPVTADHGIPNGRLSSDPWRGQALTLLHEARAAAQVAGYEFRREEAEHDLWSVVRATAENRSSMLQDLDRGRPTEIEAISGEVLAVAQRAGLRLPATERAVARIRERARRAAPTDVRTRRQAQP